MARTALEALGVSKSFGPRAALRDVDLVARRGTVHGLLGPNGAGKTTLMRVILGLVRPDAGRIHLLGHPFYPVADAVPNGVAGLVDAPAFYPYLTGRANLMLLARLDAADADASATRDRVDGAIEESGLVADADARVAGYSTGMRQRLGLAAALLRSPELLLLDEATSSLDPAAARDVRDLARRLAADGAAVVWSSHDMAELEELCAAVTIVDSGRVIFSGSIAELRRRAPALPHALHTNDDRAARALASRCIGVRATPAVCGGLDISADAGALDAFVIALGRAGIAVRALERRTRSLQSLFLELTASADLDVAGAIGAESADDEPDWGLAS
jgi:ABC-2 type transport system ATP-binding protein